MGWLSSQVDKVLDSIQMRSVEGFEVYSHDGGYTLLYGRTRGFDSPGELVNFYNEKIKPEIEREPVSVIGSSSESVRRELHRQEGSASIDSEGRWAVDVYFTALNHEDRAFKRAVEEYSSSLFDDSRGEITYLRESFEENIITGLNATVTQAVAETGLDEENRGETDFDYFLEVLLELEE